jgi:hypothetical protein
MKTLSQKMKEFGAKNVKDGFGGFYKYLGKNFKADFNFAECDSKWWEVDLYSSDVDERVFQEFEGYNKFDTKAELVWLLLCLDKTIEEQKNK